jgi:hypothetical protein
VTSRTALKVVGGPGRRFPIGALRIASAVAVATVVFTTVAATAGTSMTVAGAASGASAAAKHRGSPSAVVARAGPAPPYDCTFNFNTDAYTGADGTASEIGWAGNHQGVVTCLGGTFFVQDGINQNFGFGLYSGAPTTWADADGYLPAQVTTFQSSGATVSITEFADRVLLGGNAYVLVYSRVAVHNGTALSVRANPDPSRGLVALDTAPNRVAPHRSVAHDYVVAVDRFGHDYAWPTPAALAGAGGFTRHFAHMKNFWNQQLAQIADVDVPDASLDDAYRSGFVYTEIARSGDDLNTGVNGYESEFSHDVVGILANLFTEGDFADAHALLLEARNVVGSQGQYEDGTWTYAWPWAIYLMKTGDLAFVQANFATAGPDPAAQPSIEDTAHTIGADRTGPGGIMGITNDIDTNGYWTVDDYEALMGLAAYRYLAQRVGDPTEVQWATTQYHSLLAATNSTLDATVARFHLAYLPCSMTEPNTANRCANPEDANWAAPFQFGKWAWDAPLFGASVSGPGLTLIDATYDYGFGRLQGTLPPDTLGGFPTDYYSTAYNAGYGSWGLASAHHRDQGILGYEFMIANDQSGPYSWWESSSAPSTTSPWVGRHPAAGQGSSPHAWGMSEANKVLLDSLLAVKSDGSLIVGRGVPASWLRSGRSMSVSHFPTTDGHRLGIRISSTGRSVSLTLSGQAPSGPVLFQLPSFVDNIAGTSAGTINRPTGTVTLAPGTRSVTVRLRVGV